MVASSNSPKAYAVKLLNILNRDREEHLLLIDRYLSGDHDDPYMPDNASTEYKLLAQRSISNWMPLLVSTPSQALYVDSYRRGRKSREGEILDADQVDPEWEHWEESRLGARQNAIHRGAIAYGHSFTVTLRDPITKRARTKGLSPLRTSAIFDDPANDETPLASITVHKWASGSGDDRVKGTATMWIEGLEYPVRFDELDDEESIEVGKGVKHGARENPVTRFAAYIDLDGRTTGVVEPAIPLQNRINQSVFDLLIAQSYGSFTVRTVTGMAPPLKREPVYEDPDDPTSEIVGSKLVLDKNGMPIPLPLPSNASRWQFAEDKDVEFGTLDGTPLDGYIQSIDMSIRHLSALSQTPPHHLLGQIANLSAEALQAAETALSRMVEGFRHSFGESWERVFRLAAEINGDAEVALDHSGEVIWRDMELRSLSASADALGKLKEQLDIPARGLWARVPGSTKRELDEWAEMAAEEQPSLVLAQSITRASTQSTINQLNMDPNDGDTGTGA